MNTEEQVRKQLVRHLEGGEAYLPLSKFVDEMPFEKVGERPYNMPYSFFELFYHITYTQRDILTYCTSEKYKNPDWPREYWPENQFPQTEDDWEDLKADYFEDRNELEGLILDTDNALMRPVKNSKEHTLLRELMLVIEHTSYHTGQLLTILRLLDLHKS